MAKRDSNRNLLRASSRPRAAHPPEAGGQRVPVICLGLFVLVVWVFWPSVSNGFVNLDDPLYVYENVHVQKGLSWESLRWAFTTLEEGFWLPLTWLSYLLDSQLFGPRAAGFHLTNLLFHAASTLLLFVALRRMTGATWRSAAVAGLFALHPLHVESVAWISDRKDVLSGLFWMLSLLMYARYAQTRPCVESRGSSAQPPGSAANPRDFTLSYLLALLFFICGLMSKGTVLSLPLVLLLLDWWPLGRFQFSCLASRPSTLLRLIGEKLPFLAAGLISGLISVQGQKAFGALPGTAMVPIGDRIANAAISNAHYLSQTLWPANLAAFYPYPKAFPAWPVAGAASLGVIVSALVLWGARKRPYLAVGWFWYAVTLLPAIGLIQVGGQSRADRYTYVPLIGLFLLLVWGVCDLTTRWRHQAAWLSFAGVIVASLCLGLDRRQLSYWKDSESLLRHAIAVTEDNAMVQNNLGVALTKQGKVDEAVGCLQEAVRIAPGFAEAHNNLGTALAMQGRLDEAIGELQEALSLRPNYPQAHNDLGAALGRKGRLEEAIGHLEEAIKLAPDFVDARCNLGDALAAKGRFEEAITQYQRAVELRPDYPDVHHHLGIALSSTGRLDEAIGQFQQALRLSPDYAEAHGTLGAALARTGHLEEAIYHLREAVRLKPDFAAAQKNLRAVLAAEAASQNPSSPSRAP